MPIYSGSPQGGFGQQYGAGTYDPMLGFGQASGMGTTYNYPTRYSADYSRYAQSGQQFNQPVMGYNSYGQIFAQPQRPPPSFGKGGGGPRRPPPPTMGGKGGQQVGSPGVPSTGFDPEGYFRNRPVRGPRGDQGSRNTYGGFLDFYKRQNNPANSIFETGPVGRIAVGPTPPPNAGPYTGGFGNSVASPPFGGFGNNVPEPGPQGLPSPLVPIRKPLDQERILPDQNIANSPFGQLIGRGAGLGSMNGLLGQLSPDDPMYGMPSAPPRPPVHEPGLDMNKAFNTYQKEMQEWISRTGMTPDQYRAKVDEGIAFRNKQAAQSPVVAPPPSEVQQGQAIPNTSGYSGSFGNLFGGLGGMSSGTQVTNPNQFAVSTADIRYDPTTRTTGPSVTRYFENPVSGNFSSDLLGGLGGRFGAMQFQEGGQVPPDAAYNMDMMLSEAGPANPQSEMAGEYDRLIQMTMQAVLGQTENADEIIQMFIDEFGADAFRQLRDAVLKQQVPGAQTEGMVDGNGGGMDDQVMGMIGNQRPVAVSPGEYIVPADVVSGLGDGSSKSGADILDELNQAVRMARTGTTEQPRPLAESMR